jgi:glycosyltransferase involved in cell wall biosynthesis
LTEPLLLTRDVAGATLSAALADVTPLIITFNEEPNIARVLDKLTWAQRIVVVDSGSTDETLRILTRYPQADIVRRPFDTFANQCNFGLTQVQTPWVLSLDADYVLSDELVEELRQLDLSGDVAGYSARFIYMVHGKALRGTLYPARTILYKTAAARYHDEGHGHRVDVRGAVARLNSPIYHDDRKPLSRWLASQRTYAQREADFLLAASPSDLRPQDRLRLMLWPAPFAALLYALFAKGCILDGWRGWHYALQRLLAECMLSLELLDRRLSGGGGVRHAGTSD